MVYSSSKIRSHISVAVEVHLTFEVCVLLECFVYIMFGTGNRYNTKHSGIATSIRLQKHTDILTVYKEYGMIMEEPLVNETDIS